MFTCICWDFFFYKYSSSSEVGVQSPQSYPERSRRERFFKAVIKNQASTPLSQRFYMDAVRTRVSACLFQPVRLFISTFPPVYFNLSPIKNKNDRLYQQSSFVNCIVILILITIYTKSYPKLSRLLCLLSCVLCLLSIVFFLSRITELLFIHHSHLSFHHFDLLFEKFVFIGFFSFGK